MTTVERREKKPPAGLHEKLVWNYADLSALTGISARELQRMVARGQLPKPRKVGKLSLFVPAAVRAAIEALPELHAS